MQITQQYIDDINFLTEKAINEAMVNANQQWRDNAIKCLREICMTHELFTVNDVRPLVESYGFTTHDKRAMGGVIKYGKSKGWLEATGITYPSKVGHKVPMQLWRSKIKNEKN